MGGKGPKRKGDRVEREFVNLLNQLPGVDAERVPLSGAAGGRFSGDITVKCLHADYVAEVKARTDSRSTGWKMLERWLADNSFLFLKENGKRALVVMPWDIFEELLEDQFVVPVAETREGTFNDRNPDYDHKPEAGTPSEEE